MIRGKVLAVDTETTGLDPYHGDKPFSLGMTDDLGNEEYWEWDVDPLTREVKYKAEDLKRIQQILGDPTIVKVFHNRKFDVRMMRMHMGIKVRGICHDTALMSHTYYAADFSNHKLKPLAKKFLHFPTEDLETLHAQVLKCRRFGNKIGWRLCYVTRVDDEGNIKREAHTEGDYWMPRMACKLFPREARAMGIRSGSNREYCLGDCRRTILLYFLFSKSLKKEGLYHVYTRERLLFPITYAMESIGVRVTKKRCRAEIEICRGLIKDSLAKIHAFAGPKFNPRSGPQKIDLIYNRLKCPILDSHVTKKGNPQVTKVVLEIFSKKHPVLRDMILHDRAQKAINTYYLNYLRMAIRDPDTGEWIIHPNYKQVGTVTGRFSCTTPNLQNVPKRAPKGDLMERVRGPFGPRKGYRWYHFDYKAIEARLFADEANEKDMLKLFAEGRDPYVELVDRVGKIAGKKVLLAISEDPKQQRQVCKNNFLGVLYGEMEDTMSRYLGIRDDYAHKIYGALNDSFPRVRPFMDEMIAVAEKQGYVVNRYGRRTPVPRGEEYVAVNYVIQPDAADLIKGAMLRLWKLLHLNRSSVRRSIRMVMQIHDELVFEIKIGHDTPKLIKKIATIMADNEGKFRVATPVDVECAAKSWNERVPVEL